MAKDIIVPVDSSEQAEKALTYAVEENPDADLTLVHAYGLQRGAGYGAVVQPTDEALEAAKQHANDVLESAREMAEDAGFDGDIETLAESGKPEEVISSQAEDADAIYIGSHGRDKTARVLLGSVAEKVVRRAPVPVTVVK
jgi:nucleotide-binding universal stress UspA family protein